MEPRSAKPSFVTGTGSRRDDATRIRTELNEMLAPLPDLAETMLRGTGEFDRSERGLARRPTGGHRRRNRR